jgi:TolB-like protein/DNA-binding winged helix-turn-helix (wHTH) protein/Tfp pilus assembly protein PilF
MALRPGENSLHIGEWIADPSDDSLTRGTERARLDPRAMQLLLRLARSAGTVVSQSTLLDDVWAGVVVSPASVYQTISQLRKALGDTQSPPSYIETVSRKGYRLVAPVSPVIAPAAAPGLSPVPPGPAPSAAAFTERRARPAPSRAYRLVAIVVAVVLVAAAASWLVRETPPDSIVVLPFEDLTPGKTEQAFCDGMTEELSNWLVQIPGLRVVARASANRFRGKDIDVRQIGRDLGVTHVLKGSLRRSGNMMRITAQLIDTKTGYGIWSRPYTVLVDDFLKTQEGIAREVAANMQLRLTLETDRRFAQRSSDSPTANRAYVIAQTHRTRATRADNQQAIALYRQALDIDPGFAMAKIGLASAYMDQQQFEDRALEDIDRDVEPLFADLERTAPNVAEFYITRASWRNDHLAHDAAIKDLEHALAINPESSRASATLGYIYLTMAQPRAAHRQIAAAAALDPFNATIHALSCTALTDLGNFEEASGECEQARALEPESQSALTALSNLEEARGNAAGALKWTTIALHASNDVAELHADRGRWLMRLGLVEEAHAAYIAAIATTGEAGQRNLGLAGLGLRSTFAVDGAEGVHRLIAASHMDTSDDPDVLFFLAEAALLTGDTAAARGFAVRALARSKPEQLASPWDARNGRSSLIIAAAAERASGDAKLAEQHLAAAQALVERLILSGMRRHDTYILQAEIAAMRGDGDGAMRALTTAAELGWRYVWLAQHLPYLESLRGRADFKALIAGIEARNARDGAAILALLDPQPAR